VTQLQTPARFKEELLHLSACAPGDILPRVLGALGEPAQGVSGVIVLAHRRYLAALHVCLGVVYGEVCGHLQRSYVS
jgi:hypothetical protein